jgi:predicted nucleotidyltransferase
MYVPQSDANSIDDKDVMAVCVPPKEYYFGYDPAFAGDGFPTNGVREVTWEDWDVVIYEARKFIGLLAKGNPNVLSLLWLEPNYYIQKNAVGQLLIDNRHLFVGKHVYHSFSGYAYSQLHRMEAGGKYNGHAGDKRKELVTKYGYDTKNAAHLIRLLRMGIEFLTDGELHVLREDASQLLEIKHGEWTLERVKDEAARLFPLAEQAYVNSKLPNKPNPKKVSDLTIEIVETGLGLRP